VCKIFVGTLLLRFYSCDIRVYILVLFCYSICVISLFFFKHILNISGFYTLLPVAFIALPKLYNF